MTKWTDNQFARLFLLLFSHLVTTSCYFSILAMAPFVKTDLNMSAAQFGFFASAYFGAQMTFSLPSGNLVDRIGIGRSLALAMFLIAAGIYGFSAAQSAAPALFYSFLLGTGSSIINPATGKAVMDWFPPGRRGTIMGTKQLGVPMGGVVSAFMGAAAVLIDWRIILAILGTFGLLTAAICIFGLPRGEKRQNKSNFKSDLFQMMRNTRLNMLSVVSVPFNMGQATFYTYLTLFLREAAQASQPVAALCLALSQIAAASGRVGFAYISDAFLDARRKPMIIFAVSVAMTSMVIASFVSAGWNVLALGLLAFVMGGTIAGFAALMITAAVESLEPELTGSAIGYRSMAWSLGGIIGPPIFGAILDLSGSYSVAWLALAMIVGTGFLIFVFKFKEAHR